MMCETVCDEKGAGKGTERMCCHAWRGCYGLSVIMCA